MAPQVIAAYIAAAVSVFCAIFAAVNTRRSERRKREHEARLEDLRSQLARETKRFESHLSEQSQERNARRDYEYEARKRLYTEVEPVLFQLVELSESALHRIYSLARTARQGNLSDPNTSWLAEDAEGYYYFSSIYHLVAPVAAVKLLQRRITFVDLSVERSIAAEYSLAKRLLVSFTDDHEFASYSPALQYDPNSGKLEGPKAAALLKSSPEIYWRQGIFSGMLEGCAEALLARSESDVPIRLKGFSEAEAERMIPDSAWSKALSEIRDLLVNFHPAKRPVLWRMLVTQACIYRTFMEMREAKLAGRSPHARPLAIIPIEERKELDWRTESEKELHKDALTSPFDVAAKYFEKRIPSLFRKDAPEGLVDGAKSETSERGRAVKL